MDKTLDQTVKDLKSKFISHNTVTVERSSITNEQCQLILSAIEAKDKEIAELRKSLELIKGMAGSRSTDQYEMDACLCEIWCIADSAKLQKGTE